MKIKIRVRGEEKKSSFYDYARDGVTQSLLSIFLECRRKAEMVLEGWTPRGTPLAMTHGTVGHGVLQLVYEDNRLGKLKGAPSTSYLNKVVGKVEKMWLEENKKPTKQMLQDLELSLMYAQAVLPSYFDFWKDDFKKLTWEKVEGAFKLPFQLSDGRKTFIRGKMDGVFKRNGLWLFETKFKSMINEGDIAEALPLDMQVLMYLQALKEIYDHNPSGVLYNVVRRPGLQLKKSESLSAFSKRVSKDVEKRPEWYFYRFEVAITKSDLEKWATCFKGLMKDFMDWRDGKVSTYPRSGACHSKYGRCWGLTPCVTGSYDTLVKREKVFNELEET